MIRNKLLWCARCGVIASVLWCVGAVAMAQEPPFWGTVWIDTDIIRPGDWSAYRTLSYGGIAQRFVFDRRDNAFSTKSMHLFDATYADGLEIEVQVNSIDFSISTAQTYATYYAQMVGQLPTSLRADVETMWIHGGGALPFGGGNKNILIHVDVEVGTIPFLEEILVHEAAHTSYGPAHDMAPAWHAAQNADPNFISFYGRDYPNREDVAESLLMWYALRYRSDRLDAATIAATLAAIPNRLAYFDALPFEISEPTPGDFDKSGVADARDIPAMLTALANLPAYKTQYHLNDSDLLAIGDLDHSGGVTNADLQGLLHLLANLGSGSAAPVPEPSPLVLATLGVLNVFAVIRWSLSSGRRPIQLFSANSCETNCSICRSEPSV